MNDSNVITSEDGRIASALHALKRYAKEVDHGQISSAARRRTIHDRQRGNRSAESQPPHLAGVSNRTQDTLYRVRRQSPLSGIRHREDARGKLPQCNPLKTRKRAGVEACPFPCLSGSIRKPVLISNDNRRCRVSVGCEKRPILVGCDVGRNIRPYPTFTSDSRNENSTDNA